MLGPLLRRTLVVAVAGTAFFLTGCAGSGSDPPAPASPSPSTAARAALDGAALARLLPSEKSMEDLLGVSLEVTTRPELTQLHEGATVQARSGQVGFYHRPPGGSGELETGVGGYVALSLFATETDAVRFLATNPSYDESRKPNPQEGLLKVFDLADVADAGSGSVFVEDVNRPRQAALHNTNAVARIDQLVVEVVLFHDAGEDLIPETRRVVGDVRSRMLPVGVP